MRTNHSWRTARLGFLDKPRWVLWDMRERGEVGIQRGRSARVVDVPLAQHRARASVAFGTIASSSPANTSIFFLFNFNARYAAQGRIPRRYKTIVRNFLRMILARTSSLIRRARSPKCTRREHISMKLPCFPRCRIWYDL